MQIINLGSSSSGNCTLISHQQTNILIDCGFSKKYIESRLNEIGLELYDISALFITHLHNDHINLAVIRYYLSRSIPVYIPDLIYPFALKYFRNVFEKVNNFPSKLKSSQMEFDSLLISSFPVPHDSAGGCCGFNVISEDGKKLTFCTDIGYVNKHIAKNFLNSDALVIESNHDLEMLNNSGRPKGLIERIIKIGHLSNDSCLNLLIHILDNSQIPLTNVMLAHISQECNTNEIALNNIGDWFQKEGIKSIKLNETFQYNSSKVIIL